MTFETKKFSVAGSAGFLVATAIATLFMSEAAMAQECEDANGISTVQCGNGASATEPNSTAVGTNSSATNSNATAVGAASDAEGADSTALGGSTVASGSNSTAVGYSAASGIGATAVGADSLAVIESLAVGTGAQANVFGSTAIGNFASADHENSVAIGYGSFTNDPDTVSFGGGGSTRRLTNVSEGIFASDAVNMAQLTVVQDLAIQNFQAIDGLQDGIDANTQSILFVAGFVADNTVAIEDLQFANAVQDVAIAENQMAISGLVEVNAQQDAQIAENTEAVGKLTVTVEEHGVQIGQNTAGIAANAGAISVNAAEIAENAGNILTAFEAIEANGTMISSNTQRIDLIEASMFDLTETVGRLDREIDGSTAVAIAMSGNSFLPNQRFNLTANVGTYEGAVAGSLQLGVMVREDIAVNAGIATGFNKGGGTGARVGVTFGW